MNIEKYKENALKILFPIKQVDDNTKANEKLLFFAERSDAGREIQDYYLVYFLFVNLLGFKDTGRSEKLAWSIQLILMVKHF